MKTIISYLQVYGIILLISSCNSRFDQDLTDQDIKFIRNDIRKYEEIVHKGEFEYVKTIFTDDVVFIRPDNDNIIGIDSLYRIHYSNLKAVPGFWKKAEEIKGSGKIAYSFGSFGFSSGELSGKYMEIRIKQPDGTWPISRLIWNEKPPE
jgi:ketosteroid isomerase-like protein